VPLQVVPSVSQPVRAFPSQSHQFGVQQSITHWPLEQWELAK
jgi:hypothetical protein